MSLWLFATCAGAEIWKKTIAWRAGFIGLA